MTRAAADPAGPALMAKPSFWFAGTRCSSLPPPACPHAEAWRWCLDVGERRDDGTRAPPHDGTRAYNLDTRHTSRHHTPPTRAHACPHTRSTCTKQALRAAQTQQLTTLDNVGGGVRVGGVGESSRMRACEQIWLEPAAVFAAAAAAAALLLLFRHLLLISTTTTTTSSSCFPTCHQTSSSGAASLSSASSGSA